MSKPLPPAFVRLMRQNGINGDCAIFALATLCGTSYEEALAACVCVLPSVLDDGLKIPQIRRAAKLLGAPMRRVPPGRYDIEEATGILYVRKGKDDAHVVVLWAGRVIDGEGSLWLHPEDYLRHHKYAPYSLLVRTDAE
jgi:hypothetical protein